MITQKPITEVWVKIARFNGAYEISNFGRIKSVERVVAWKKGQRLINERIVKTHINVSGYLGVGVSFLGRRHYLYLHVEMARAFIPNPDNKTEVNHLDGNRSNCCLSNLEWVTPSENVQHSYDVLGKVAYYKGVLSKDNPRSIPILFINCSTGSRKEYHSMKDASKDLKLDVRVIKRSIINNKPTPQGYVFSKKCKV